MNMNIKELGEFGFIERIAPQFAPFIKEGTTGIGDDCAIIPFGKENLLVTTDLLVEDIHFLKSGITPFNLGYKSLAVNVSDIAGMGGYPTATFLSVAIPPWADVEFLDEFMRGYRELSGRYNLPLLGGDTTKSPDKFVVNVCVLGTSEPKNIKERSGAKVGQYVCVTGNLGSSACGLQLILERERQLEQECNSEDNEYYNSLILAHNKPEPRVEFGQLLGACSGVGAMMDISDGVASDIKHILKASGVGVVLDLDALPISLDMRECAAKNGWSAVNLAAGGGEDYELLFTIDKEDFNKFAEYGFTVIGEITDKSGELVWCRAGNVVKEGVSGFVHF